MEGHSLGTFDNKQTAPGRNIVPGCLDWNKNNLQVGSRLLMFNELYVTNGGLDFTYEHFFLPKCDN